MVRVQTGTLALRSGLSLLAALMITTSAWAQDATGGDTPTTEPAVSVDPAPTDDGAGGDDGQSGDAGEPAIGDGDPPDVVIDDGLYIGGWEDDPAAGGDDGTGDDGAGGDDGWVDDGTGDDGWVDDGSGGDDGWVDDGSGDDGWVDDGTGGDDGWVDDGTGDDGWVDDGSGDDGWVDDGTGGEVVLYPIDLDWNIGIVVGDDGVVYYLDGGPVTCATCEGEIDAPMEEIYQTTGGLGPVVLPVTESSGRSSAAPGSFGATALARGGNAAMSVADCLAAYPELPWICVWQFGADQ